MDRDTLGRFECVFGGAQRALPFAFEATPANGARSLWHLASFDSMMTHCATSRITLFERLFFSLLLDAHARVAILRSVQT